MSDPIIFSLLLLGIIIAILVLAARRCDALSERAEVAEARLSLSRMGRSTLLEEIALLSEKLKRQGLALREAHETALDNEEESHYDRPEEDLPF